MKADIIVEIKKLKKQTFNASFNIIANFIFDNINIIKQFSIYDIARKTNTSPATIVRFCKKMGIEGYKDLLIILEGYKVSEDNEINLLESITFIEKYNEIVLKSIESISHNHDQFKIVKHMIKSANKIYIFGFSGNGYLLELFYSYLVRIGYDVIFSRDRDQQVAYSNNIKNDDLAIIMSYKGTDDKLMDIAKNLKLSSAKQILISKELSPKGFFNEDVYLKLPFNEGVIEGRQKAEMGTLFILISIIEYILIDEEISKKLIKQDVL